MLRPVLAAAALVAAAVPAPASAASRWTRCPDVQGAVLVDVARTSCASASALAEAVVAAPTSRSARTVAAHGWTPLRAADVPDRAQHDLVALRGAAAARIRRTGPAPDLDGFAAGRELVFARARLVGGRPLPREAATCTSAFLVRLAPGRLGGLSAAHCAGLRSDRTAHRRNVALRRPPAAGIVLGRVQRMVSRSAPLDALVVPVPAGEGRTRAAVVDRGTARPPWAVAGTADPTAGRRVCFTGRTSGVDRCGRVRGAAAARTERFLSLRAGVVVRCTTVRAAPGDSGGPAYTAPGSDGRVRALGIVTLVTGVRQLMCFTPVKPVLRRLGAQVVTRG